MEDLLDELAQLVDTAGGVEISRIVQERERPTPAYFIGQGKAEYIAQICEQLDIAVVVFDDELTPVQQRNLEKITGCKVIDRTGVILDIFAQRAHTREGKLQVELAQLNYLLPRLTGKGILLSRLGGGIGTRGPGETKLEADRRRIYQRIAKIKHDLEEVRQHRQLHRSNRQSIPLPTVALVGYTNSGKSTLLNALTQAGVLAEDKLFATLDPTTRRVTLPNKQTVLFTDTVGFIRKLPHQLIEAFKATLEEVAGADILLHVIDAAQLNVEEQVAAVNSLLAELGLQDKPAISVLNKIDALENENLARCVKRMVHGDIAISAIRGDHIPELLKLVSERLNLPLTRIALNLPYSGQHLMSLLRQRGRILRAEYLNDYILVEAEVDYKTAAIVDSRLKELAPVH